MAYSELDQSVYDLNWYFIDKLKRIVHAASVGGRLPKIVETNDEGNDAFDRMVQELPERYNIKRNEKWINFLVQSGQIDNVEDYVEDFERMARRGVHSFDRYEINNSSNELLNESPLYIWVAYPVYNPFLDKYPVMDSYLRMIDRTNVILHKGSYAPMNFTDYLDPNKLMKGWRQ